MRYLRKHSSMHSVFLGVALVAIWSGRTGAETEYEMGACDVRVKTPGSHVSACQSSFQNAGCFLNWNVTGCTTKLASAEGLFAHPHNCRVVGDETLSDWFECKAYDPD